jgi:hypothetical protein
MAHVKRSINTIYHQKKEFSLLFKAGALIKKSVKLTRISGFDDGIFRANLTLHRVYLVNTK